MQLAEAREHLVAAEAAFREVGETDAADEVARQRASIEAKLAKVVCVCVCVCVCV